MPKETVAEMTECLNSAKSRLTDTTYAMQFDVEVTESGHAGRVRFRDAYPSEPALEACIADALKGMSSPVPVTMLLPKEKAVSPESRKFMGQGVEELLVAGGASLGPVFIVAAGVTLIVGLTSYITSETAEKKRCRQVKQECIAYCSDTTLPTSDFGWRFQKCKNDCLARHGCPRDS